MFRGGLRPVRVALAGVFAALLGTQLSYGEDPDPVALRQAQMQSWQNVVLSARLSAARELAVARQSVVGQQAFTIPTPPIQSQVEKLTAQQEQMLRFVIAMMRLNGDPRFTIKKIKTREQMALNLGMKWVKEVNMAAASFRAQLYQSAALVGSGMARGHQASGAYGRVVARRAQQALRGQIRQMRIASTERIRKSLVPQMRTAGDPRYTLARLRQMLLTGRRPVVVRPPIAPGPTMPSAVVRPPAAPPLTGVQQQMELRRP